MNIKETEEIISRLTREGLGLVETTTDPAEQGRNAQRIIDLFTNKMPLSLVASQVGSTNERASKLRIRRSMIGQVLDDSSFLASKAYYAGIVTGIQSMLDQGLLAEEAIPQLLQLSYERFIAEIEEIAKNYDVVGIFKEVLFTLRDENMARVMLELMDDDRWWSRLEAEIEEVVEPIRLVPVQAAALPVTPVPTLDPEAGTPALPDQALTISPEQAEMLAVVEKLGFLPAAVVAKELLVAIITYGGAGISMRELAIILNPTHSENKTKLAAIMQQYYGGIRNIKSMFKRNPALKLNEETRKVLVMSGKVSPVIYYSVSFPPTSDESAVVPVETELPATVPTPEPVVIPQPEQTSAEAAQSQLLAIVESEMREPNGTPARILRFLIEQGGAGASREQVAAYLMKNDETIRDLDHAKSKISYALKTLKQKFGAENGSGLVFIAPVRGSSQFYVRLENDVEPVIQQPAVVVPEAGLESITLEPKEFTLPDDFDVDAVIKLIFPKHPKGPSADLLMELIISFGVPQTSREFAAMLFKGQSDEYIALQVKQLPKKFGMIASALQRSFSSHGFILVESTVPNPSPKPAGARMRKAYSLVYTPPADVAVQTDDVDTVKPPDVEVKKK